MVKVSSDLATIPEAGEPRYQDVYHDDTECPDGLHVVAQRRALGTGNRPKCVWCAATASPGPPPERRGATKQA
jgi:hypothetical protein